MSRKRVINAKEVDKMLIKSISQSPTNLAASFRFVSNKLGYNVSTVSNHYYRILRKKTPIFMIRTSAGITVNNKRIKAINETANGFKLEYPLLKLKGLTDKQKIELFDMLIA